MTLLFAAVLLGCTSDETTSGSRPTELDASAGSSAPQAGSLEIWDERAKGGPIHQAEGVLRDEPPCTTIAIGDTLYAALWPEGSSRTSDGVVVEGHLYRFGATSEFPGRT